MCNCKCDRKGKEGVVGGRGGRGQHPTAARDRGHLSVSEWSKELVRGKEGRQKTRGEFSK